MRLENSITNYDAEKHVLSCILLDTSLLSVCDLTSIHFADAMFASVFTNMMRLQQEGKSVDVTLMGHIAGDSYTMDDLFDIASHALTPALFQDYCTIVRENYNRRKIREQARKVILYCEDTEKSYTELIAEATAVAKTDEAVESNRLIPGLIATVERLFDRHESLMICEDTGYKLLNGMIGGWRGGSLYIIGARPSVGKSTFAMNLAMNAGKQGIQTAFFSTEMPPHEIHVRMLSNIAQVESRTIEKGADAVAEKITDAVNVLSTYAECNIYNGFTNEELERLISKEVATGTKIIFVDYLQNIKIVGKYGNRNDAIGAITAMLKAQALKHNITIVCLAQLNRQFTEGQEPELAHLRDSGNIEQDADVVMFLEGFDEYTQEINLFVKKNRHGTLGQVILKYTKKYFTFLNR